MGDAPAPAPARYLRGYSKQGRSPTFSSAPYTEGDTMGTVPFGRTNLLKATLLIVTGVLAACLVALVGTAESVKAAFPGENGKIFFYSDRDGNEEI